MWNTATFCPNRRDQHGSNLVSFFGSLFTLFGRWKSLLPGHHRIAPGRTRVEIEAASAGRPWEQLGCFHWSIASNWESPRCSYCSSRSSLIWFIIWSDFTILDLSISIIWSTLIHFISPTWVGSVESLQEPPWKCWENNRCKASWQDKSQLPHPMDYSWNIGRTPVGYSSVVLNYLQGANFFFIAFVSNFTLPASLLFFFSASLLFFSAFFCVFFCFSASVFWFLISLFFCFLLLLVLLFCFSALLLFRFASMFFCFPTGTTTTTTKTRTARTTQTTRATKITVTTAQRKTKTRTSRCLCSSTFRSRIREDPWPSASSWSIDRAARRFWRGYRSLPGCCSKRWINLERRCKCHRCRKPVAVGFMGS